MSNAPHMTINTGSEDRLEALPRSLAFGHLSLTVLSQSRSHHGDSLRMLGHAAEYLVDSRMFSPEIPETMGDREAVHILMRVRREVFDEYAVIADRRHSVTDWGMGRAVRIYGAA